MFIEIATDVAITGAVKAYEHRSDIAKWWNRFTYVLKQGKLTILVVGPGGVGKSTLSKFLYTPSLKIPPDAYTESLREERMSLPGDAVAELITAPGQKRHIAKWEDLFDALKKRGKTFGVVFVTAYGHHATPLTMSQLRGKDDSVPPSAARYFGERRQAEIEALRAVEVLLRRHTKPFWMISLVTKQDLWWPDRKNVERYYCQGEYADIIESIRVAHAATGFEHEYFSLAVHSQNLYHDEGKILQATSAGYDDIIKYSHQKAFLDLIEKLTQPK